MPIKRLSGTSRGKEPARGRFRAQIGFPQSIRGNLILILCILLIPTLMIQIYTYHEKFESHRADKLQGNLEIARAVGKTFETFVQDLFSDELIIGMACSPPKPTSTTDQNEILVEARKAHPAIWHLSWADPSGVVSASTDPELIGRDLHDRYSFLELISGRDWVVSSLMLSESGKSYFFVCRAVRGNSDDLLGVVFATVLSESLEGIIGIERSRNADVAIVDKEGRLVISYPRINYTWEQRDWLSAYPIIKEALKSKEVVTTVRSRLDNVNRFVALTPIQLIGWVAAAGRPELDAMTEVRASLLPATIIFLFITITVSGIALTLSRKISDSIEKLRDHALALGRGEDQHSLAQSGNADLNDLMNAFNKMSHDLTSRQEELRKSRDELEKRVQERTVELEIANNELRQLPSKLIAVQEEERRMLAAELHDSIGQTLVALKINIEHILMKLRKVDGEDVLSELEHFVRKLIQAIHETRTIYTGLRPSLLEDFGVISALRWYCEEQFKLHPERHIELVIDSDGVQIPKELYVPIFRISQEALNNIARHSKAEWVEITLTSDGHWTRLVVSDDGIGIDIGNISNYVIGGGIGLTCMRERAEMSGGSFSIESTPGGGTTIRASWPAGAAGQQ